MIKVYSKENCIQCNFTKKYLEDNQIPYVEVDVMKDEKELEYLKSLGFMSMPVIIIPGLDPFSGFRPDLLAKAGE